MMMMMISRIKLMKDSCMNPIKKMLMKLFGKYLINRCIDTVDIYLLMNIHVI